MRNVSQNVNRRHHQDQTDRKNEQTITTEKEILTYKPTLHKIPKATFLPPQVPGSKLITNFVDSYEAFHSHIQHLHFGIISNAL